VTPNTLDSFEEAIPLLYLEIGKSLPCSHFGQKRAIFAPSAPFFSADAGHRLQKMA
jgi:hypothetical protein